MKTLNEPITSKYKEVVADFRYLLSLGFDHEESIETSINENLWRFESEKDKQILTSWMNGSFGKTELAA